MIEHSPAVIADVESGRCFPKPPSFDGFEQQESVTKPPLTARYPDILRCQGPDGEMSVLSLTEMMVWQCNKVFQCERKIDQYSKKLDSINNQQSKIELRMALVEK